MQRIERVIEMTKKAMQDFEKMLLGRGYRKWTRSLYETEDYDISRMVKDDAGEDKYQIIFRFWDWTKYGRPELSGENEASIDLVVMPCFDGRADLEISSCSSEIQLDVERMEKLAEDYYEFIKARLI